MNEINGEFRGSGAGKGMKGWTEHIQYYIRKFNYVQVNGQLALSFGTVYVGNLKFRRRPFVLSITELFKKLRCPSNFILTSNSTP